MSQWRCMATSQKRCCKVAIATIVYLIKSLLGGLESVTKAGKLQNLQHEYEWACTHEVARPARTALNFIFGRAMKITSQKHIFETNLQRQSFRYINTYIIFPCKRNNTTKYITVCSRSNITIQRCANVVLCIVAVTSQRNISAILDKNVAATSNYIVYRSTRQLEGGKTLQKRCFKTLRQHISWNVVATQLRIIL